MTGNADLVREEVEATIERAGFASLDPGSIRIDVTDSFQSKLGDCRAIGPSDCGATAEYQIRIARRLFEGTGDDQWRDTVRHEVAHAYILGTVGSAVQPHGDEWKDAARRAGADPVARYEGDDTVDAEYVLSCPNGCFERGYVQRSKRVKQPWLYTCDECGTRPVSYDVGAPPTAPEPGTCYVESIPWETQRDRDGHDHQERRVTDGVIEVDDADSRQRLVDHVGQGRPDDQPQRRQPGAPTQHRGREQMRREEHSRRRCPRYINAGRGTALGTASLSPARLAPVRPTTRGRCRRRTASSRRSPRGRGSHRRRRRVARPRPGC